MSDAVQQFIQIVRQAVKPIATNYRNMYCPVCGEIKPHSISEQGRWETYTCQGCGHKQVFCVR